jgi:hypothetical protein
MKTHRIVVASVLVLAAVAIPVAAYVTHKGVTRELPISALLILIGVLSLLPQSLYSQLKATYRRER